jgi:hypothetical protein
MAWDSASKDARTAGCSGDRAPSCAPLPRARVQAGSRPARAPVKAPLESGKTRFLVIIVTMRAVDIILKKRDGGF